MFPKVAVKDLNKIKRNPNVFKNWIIDSDEVIEECTKCDFECWKVSSFVKDAANQNDIKELFKDNYADFKDLFTHIACRSNWPCIS